MGVLPERDWILRAPTLQRKLALTAKVQDEVGHGQLLYRVVEDLGKLARRLSRRPDRRPLEVPQRLPLPDAVLGDVGVIAWLVDAAAIISQKALLKCSYAPYAWVMRKICWEESFHILHGRDVLTLVTGTQEQRELVQEALDRWWEPLMMFHGNPIPAEEDPMVRTGGSRGQDERGGAPAVSQGLRAQVLELGLTLPDPRLRRRKATATGPAPSPTGSGCSPSSRGTGRPPRSGSPSGGSRARRSSGSRGRVLAEAA